MYENRKMDRILEDTSGIFKIMALVPICKQV